MPVDKDGRSPGYLPSGYKKSSRTTLLRSERDGSMTRNTETRHWDGRQDAHVRPETIVAKLGVKED